jgi:hypothetical protein
MAHQRHAGSAAIAATVLLATAAAGAVVTTDRAAYAEVLERFVTDDGLVLYEALKEDPEDLDAYLGSVATLDLGQLERLPESERMALWINAYNAITLKAIISSYPIRGRGFSALRYPSSSIRQIDGVWKEDVWVVAGREVSLDDIEHEILRARFAEPRIHMALVCAALGCPPLRQEPYVGARLDEQLEDQARRYLASPAGLKMDPERREIQVSAIFKWFREDFESAGGVRAFLARHSPEGAREKVASPDTKIRYLDYDWSLNDAGSPP